MNTRHHLQPIAIFQNFFLTSFPISDHPYWDEEQLAIELAEEQPAFQISKPPEVKPEDFEQLFGLFIA